ncbi:Lipoprotein lipase, partial [Fragariocoptes setiger]
MSTTPPTIDGLISLMRSYPRIAAATKTLGAYLGKFLLDLHRVHNYNLDQMHLIGFSLGAHVSGFAGKYVRANSNQTIGHITGLDPAGPCFRDNKAQDRLDRMDARYVDVIHTAGYSYGISQRIGHRDIYVNGGKKQPHCKIWNMNCQHCFVASLYSKRRSGCQAVAYQCGSYEQFEAGHCPDCENNESRCTLVQSAQQSMVTESEARNYRAAYPSEEELANKSQDFKFNYPKFMDKYYIKTGSTRVRPGQTTRFNNICLYHYQVKVKSSIAINKKSLLLTTLVPEYSSPLIKMQVNLKSFKTNLYTGLLTFSDMEAPLLFKEGEITIDSGSNQNDMPEIQLKIEFMSNMDPA